VAATPSRLPLRAVRVDPGDLHGEFPFSVPAIGAFRELSLAAPVTFLVGENGSGKSTFLEALAWAAESVVAGSFAIDRDATLAHAAVLGRALHLVWNRRTRRGFFLRAEDFFGLVKDVNAKLAHHRAETERIRAENPHLPEAELARISTPHTSSAAGLESRHGADADARSHGEQFLAFFQSRVVPGGLYLLDEPEAPRSPQRQLAFLSLLKDAAEQRACQFVIATHSPILMALPGAAIVSFDAAPPCVVAWDALESVQLVRDFLNAPGRYLRHL
jgi:predicted ATPase